MILNLVLVLRINMVLAESLFIFFLPVYLSIFVLKEQKKIGIKKFLHFLSQDWYFYVSIFSILPYLYANCTFV